MPRNFIEIDLAEVERLAGLGLTYSEIALALGISETTLYSRKRESTVFAGAIKKGQARAAMTVANKLFGLCEKGDLGAIIWYEKTRRGLSDRMTHGFDDDIDWTKVPADVLEKFRAKQITIDDVRRSLK